MPGLQLGVEGEGIHAHLLDHGQQAVAARGREVLLETYGVDEVQVGVENLLRRAAVHHTHEQCRDAFGYYGVAVGRIVYLAVLHAGVDPQARLTSVDEVFVGLVRGIHRRERIAQFDKIVVLVEPVVEYGEVLDDLILNSVFHIFSFDSRQSMVTTPVPYPRQPTGRRCGAYGPAWAQAMSCRRVYRPPRP